jgi:steroid delta-isomerase-like uncharacterized protein
MPAPTDVVAAYLAAHNAHDLPALARLYAPFGAHHEMATGSRREGGAAITSGLDYLLGAFPDAHWDHEPPLSDGARAAAPYVLTGTLTAPFGPYLPAGQTLSIAGVLVLDMSDAGILLSRDYWDLATFRRQLAPAAEVAA